MADNTRGGSESGTAPLIATDEVTYSGETADVQLVRLVNVVGSEGAKTVEAITTGAQYIEDTAIGTGQGTLVVARRDDALATLTPAEGDAVGLSVTARGALWSALADTSGVQIKGMDAYDTAVASPNTGTLSAGQPDRRFTSVSLATAVSSTQSWDCNAADMVLVHVGTSTTGTFLFETSADGSNWAAAETYDITPDQWVTSVAQTPTANKIYRIITNGLRLLRARTVTTLGATVALTATLAARSSIINAIDTGPAPHNFGYAETGVSAQYTSAQTSTTIGPTVSSTQRMVVTYLQIQAGGTVAATQVSIYFGTGAFSRGTSKPLFDGEFAPSSTSKPGFVAAKPNGWQGAADEELKITSVGAANPLTVTIWYYLVNV